MGLEWEAWAEEGRVKRDLAAAEASRARGAEFVRPYEEGDEDNPVRLARAFAAMAGRAMEQRATHETAGRPHPARDMELD